MWQSFDCHVNIIDGLYRSIRKYPSTTYVYVELRAEFSSRRARSGRVDVSIAYSLSTIALVPLCQMRVIIVGSGIAGSATRLTLQRLGASVKVSGSLDVAKFKAAFVILLRHCMLCKRKRGPILLILSITIRRFMNVPPASSPWAPVSPSRPMGWP